MRSTHADFGDRPGIPSPTMLPGLASGPKNSELEERALERLTNNSVLPSNPTIVLDSVTWKAAAIFSVVTLASPFATRI
jgi:hypothetical protein